MAGKKLYSFGVDLNSRKVVIILVGPDGKKISHQSIYAEVYRGSDYIISKLHDTIALLMRKNFISTEDVCGIGIAVPSVYSGKTSVPSHFEGWNSIDLCQDLSSVSNLPVYLINYGTAMGFAEAQTAGGNSQCILAIDIYETLVSAGYISSENASFHFEQLNLGHMIVDPCSYPCSCGKCGCLESVGTGNAAIRYYEEYSHQKIGLSEFKRRLATGELSAVFSAEKCAQNIAICISNVLTILSPTKICIGGDFILENPYLFEQIEKKAREYGLSGINISRPELKLDSEAYGAGIMVLSTNNS